MNSKDESRRSAKSRTVANVSVGGPGIGGIVLLGGVLAVGIAAGALAGIRRRRRGRETQKEHEVLGLNNGENVENLCTKSVGFCTSSTKEGESKVKASDHEEGESSETKEWRSDSEEMPNNSAVPSLGNDEEFQSLVGIEPMQLFMENFSLQDFPAKENSKIGFTPVKEEDSPRSHFSLTMRPDTPSLDQTSGDGSDSEDLSEVQSNYRDLTEIQSSDEQSERRNDQTDLDLKEGDFTLHEDGTIGKASFDFVEGKELFSDKEYHNAKELIRMDPKLECEVSIDSFPGSQECNKVGSFVQMDSVKMSGIAFEEKSGVDEQTLAVFQELEDSGEKEAEQCNGDMPPNGGNELCQQERFDSKEDGPLYKDQFQVDSKEDMAPNKGQCPQEIIDSKEGEDPKGAIIEDVPFYKEECPQGIVDYNVSGDSKADMLQHNGECQIETVDSRESEDPKEYVPHDNEQFQYDTADSRESEVSVEDSYPGNEQCQQETANSVEDVPMYNDQCVQEKVDLREDVPVNEEQFPQETVDSKVSEDSKADASQHNEQCQHETDDSRESEVLKEDLHLAQQETLDSKEDASLHIGSMEELAPQCKEQCQQGNVDFKESKNLIEDILVDKENCKEELRDLKESEDSKVKVPFCTEQGLQDTVDSKQSENSEEDAHIRKELFQEETFDSKESEDLKRDMPLYNEQIVDYQEANELEDVHFHKEHCRQGIVDSKESELSSGDTSLFKEQCQHAAVDHEVSENFKDDPPIYNEAEENRQDSVLTEASDGYKCDAVSGKSTNEECQNETVPEEVDSKESECVCGDKPLLNEQCQNEQVDAKESKDSKEDPQIYNGPEEIKQNVIPTDVPDSCKHDTVPCQESKEIQLNGESIGCEADPTLKFESTRSVIPESISKGDKNDVWDPLASLQKGFKSEEDEPLLMNRQLPLPLKTRIIVSLFAALLTFLLYYEISKISASASKI